MKALAGVMGLVVLLGAAYGAELNTPEQLYQKALYLETAKADYQGAIPIYATIISNHAQNTAFTIKALYRQGVCHEKTGQAEQAKQCAQKLANQYADAVKANAEMTEWVGHYVKTESAMAGWDFSKKRGTDFRQLAEIKMPDHANKDQIKQYILDIVAASKEQRSWSISDPQVAMLTKVGNDNIQLLIDAFCLTGGGINNWYIERAIENLADEKSKPLILDALPIYHNLATVIVQHGWESDARHILLPELRHTGQYLPSEWIAAVASLNDSNSFPLLRDYFIKGPNKYATYKEIKDLPIENISGAVDEAWQRSKHGNDTGRTYMAIVAAEYGHVDALSTLIDVLTRASGSDGDISCEIRPAIFRVIDFRGSNEGLAQWFETNRNNLRFDPKTRKFVTDKTESVSTARQQILDKMNRIVIPQIEFREAKITDVVKWLAEQAQTLDRDSAPGAKGVNFILKLGPPDKKIPVVTMSLRNIRLMDAIGFITEVTGLKLRIEENGVIITSSDVVANPTSTAD